MVILSEELVLRLFSSSGIFLKWSIILVRIFCRRTWRFGIWWCGIWGTGSDNSKWHRICKAYQFINRSSAYYSNIYVIVTTRLVIVFVSQPKNHENTKILTRTCWFLSNPRSKTVLVTFMLTIGKSYCLKIKIILLYNIIYGYQYGPIFSKNFVIVSGRQKNIFMMSGFIISGF